MKIQYFISSIRPLEYNLLAAKYCSLYPLQPIGHATKSLACSHKEKKNGGIGYKIVSLKIEELGNYSSYICFQGFSATALSKEL